MKKIVSLMLACVLLLLSLVGCAKDTSENSGNDRTALDHETTSPAGQQDPVPNTTPGQSQIPEPDSVALALNTEVVAGLEEFDSVHLYKMTVTEPGLFEPTVIAPKPADSGVLGKYHISMYTKDGYMKEEDYERESLWEQEVGCNDYLYQLCRFRLGEGEYFIEISGDQTSRPGSDYTLTTNFTGEGNIDTVEKEWNDSWETATAIDIDQMLTGNISIHRDVGHQDIDYYTFTITEETVVHLAPRVGKGVDYSFCLYDESRTCFMNSSIGYGYGDAYETFTCKTFRLDPGKYYVSVEIDGRGIGDLNIDYYFTVVSE